MKRTLAFCIALLAIAAPAVADDASALTAAVVDAKKTPGKPAAAAVSEATRNTDHKAQDQKADAKPPGDVQMSGMSVLGNDDSPKSLVLVPWKSSQLGDAPGLSKMLDDSTQPVDRDVFLRELGYYSIKTGSIKTGSIKTGDLSTGQINIDSK